MIMEDTVKTDHQQGVPDREEIISDGPDRKQIFSDGPDS
jgi:hypothetical protein